MKLEQYAMKILVDHDCDCYTYGNCPSDNVLNDLKEAYPNGMDFPYIDVANAILNISRPRPITRSPWRMVWDNDSACDGVDCESFGAAKANAEDTLIEWMSQTRVEWKDAFDPTEEELDDYNYMICNCSVSVYEYDPDTDEYTEYWSPSCEDEEALGWKELTREDIAKEKEMYAHG